MSVSGTVLESLNYSVELHNTGVRERRDTSGREEGGREEGGRREAKGLCIGEGESEFILSLFHVK